MIQTINGRYDFAVSGGTLGVTVGTGIIIPIKSGALFATIGMLTSFTSGGAADIDFGFRPVGNATPADPMFFTATGGPIPFGTFVSTGAAFVDLPLDFFNSSFAYEITMTVNVASLTGGKFVMAAAYSRLLF